MTISWTYKAGQIFDFCVYFRILTKYTLNFLTSVLSYIIVHPKMLIFRTRSLLFYKTCKHGHFMSHTSSNGYARRNSVRIALAVASAGGVFLGVTHFYNKRNGERSAQNLPSKEIRDENCFVSSHDFEKHVGKGHFEKAVAQSRKLLMQVKVTTCISAVNLTET